MTEFLLRLFGARVDEAVHITDASLALRGTSALGWILFVLALLGAFIFWIYRQSPAHLSPARKTTLSVLRILFLGLILALLLRPVLSFTVEGNVRRVLVLLMDSSSSMQIKDTRTNELDRKRVGIAKGTSDEQAPRIEVVTGAFKNQKLNLLPRLDREFDLAAFTFGQGVVEVSARSAATQDKVGRGVPAEPQQVTADQFTWVDRLTATNAVTAIGDAMREVLNRKRGQPIAGVVLVTDGANNSGNLPLESAGLLRQEGVPVYPYGVGITQPRDIIVGNMFAPEITFSKDEVPITVRVRGQGLKGESAELVLKLGNQTVATRSLAFEEDGEQIVPLKFTPQSAGEFELEASIDPRSDETVKDNNARTQRLKVIDARIKILLVDQSPRWEFKYLQAMLLRDRRVELKCFLAEGDPGISRDPTAPYLAQFPSRKDELFQYDLIIFGDVDPRSISSAQLENINELVSRFGGALVMVAGKRFAPHAYKGTVLEKLLPVEFDRTGMESLLDTLNDKPIRLELTPAGRANPMLRLSDNEPENAALWKQLPPLYWVAKVARPKPAAEVLLVDPDPARESRFGKMPVVALQQYGLGQVMFVGTDNTWRWRKNVGDLYYTTLWGQISQRVSIQRLLGGSKRTQLTTDRQNYLSGDRVSVYARLYSVGFEPVQEPSVTAIYRIKVGRGVLAEPNDSGPQQQVTLRPVPEQPGLYRSEFIAGAPGNYEFFVEQDPATVLDYAVTEPRFELGETAMNEPLLREIASITGGVFFREENLHKLPETISQRTEKVRSPLEVELWSSPFYFLLLLAVVTAEWVLRKISYLK
jgi:hypothetical protein